ncbi:DUF6332 family protein [Streptomyces corynorhini]|uniref:Uncharacterized protein n=1 Tax=Streptomyces corynorhini TaxID=2282652 RepID=A0A370B9B4_9ACTN|nr:DUF6332 family protein [Streptomyces corynorhini]RDG36015.1 hypothetical protein DVH02_22200 [Streptomyces corynorhini]
MGTRSDAERDAITVEIGFALLTGFLAAVLVFAAVAVPPYAFDLPSAPLPGAGGVAALVFLARVVQVLWGFGRRGGQPSQPGRTSPDS